MKKIPVYAATIVILCAASGFAVAEDYGQNDAKSWGKNEMGKKMMMGEHGMSGTIENIDHQTGWIKLKTAAGVMTVHFPSQSTKDLKNGDMITVHLSFSKGEEKMDKLMDDKMMK